jgi:hypothetical protein
MTWKEFKDWAEKMGVKDTDEIEYIDSYCITEKEMNLEREDGEIRIW